MLIAIRTQNALVEIVRSHPDWESWTIMKELRKRGLEVPSRSVVQVIRSSLRKLLKKN